MGPSLEMESLSSPSSKRKRKILFDQGTMENGALVLQETLRMLVMAKELMVSGFSTLPTKQRLLMSLDIPDPSSRSKNSVSAMAKMRVKDLYEVGV